MLIQFQDYLTFENIYIWLTFGVLPFWLMLIIIPNSRITQIFVNSIILPLILSAAAAYVIYQSILLEEPILDIFKLYLSLDDLYAILSLENFLLILWIHFLALNLFLGSWVSRDALKYNMPKIFSAISLILIYFTGPIGLIVYWIVRIFFAKKISLYD